MAIKKFLGPVGFQLFAIALAGVSIFLFFATISPYVKARARLEVFQPEIRATVAAERFLRYSSLEIKEAIDYGLAAESGDGNPERRRNDEELARWRSEAQRAFAELAQTLREEAEKGATEHLKEDLAFTSRMEDLHAKLGLLEQRIRDMAKDSGSGRQIRAVIREELIPVATSFSSAANMTGSEASAARIGQADEERRAIQQWRTIIEEGREPIRSTALKRLHELEKHSAQFHEYADRIASLARHERNAQAKEC